MPENESPRTTENSSTRDAPPVEPQTLVVLPRLYKIMLGLFVATPFSLILGPFALLFVGLLVLSAIVTLIMGIVAIVRLQRNGISLTANNRTSGVISVPIAILTALLLVFTTIHAVAGATFGIEVFTLQEMEHDLTYYADHHEGRFPTPDKWCDELKGNNDTMWMAERDKDSLPSCRIAMNPASLTLGKKVPHDMVVAFSSSPGWNRVGGPELAKANRLGRVAVLFGNGRVTLVPAGNVAHLKWKPTDAGLMPPSRIPFRLAAASGIWAVILLTPVVGLRRHLAERPMRTVLIAAIAAALGALLGAAAYGALYVALFKDLYIGAWAGGISGILVAALFMAFVGRRLDLGQSGLSSLPFIHTTGAVAGLLCSVMTHSILMVVTAEASFLPMLGGLGFGIYGGIFIAVITGFALSLPCTDESSEKPDATS